MVAFAGRGVVRCPLTGDLDAAIDALRAIRPGDVQPGGTDLGRRPGGGPRRLRRGGPRRGPAIVVFSDGEDHAGRWTPGGRPAPGRGDRRPLRRDRRPRPRPPGPRPSRRPGEGAAACPASPGGPTSRSRPSPGPPAGLLPDRPGLGRPRPALSRPDRADRPPPPRRPPPARAGRAISPVRPFGAGRWIGRDLALAIAATPAPPGLAVRPDRRPGRHRPAPARLDRGGAGRGPGGRSGRAWPVGIRTGAVRRGPGCVRTRPIGPTRRPHPPLRRRLGALPAPEVPRGDRPLRGSPRRRRARSWG